MTSESKRVVVLASVLAVMAMLVVMSRLPSGDGEAIDDGNGRRDVYLREASLYEQTAAIAETRGEWDALRAEAQRGWDERTAKMIAAPSGEIASARLRGLIEQVLLDEGLGITTSETLPASQSDDDSPVVVIGISLSFEAKDSVPVYRVIDRIEHLPDAAVRVEAVTLRGPGRLGGGGTLQATVRLRAVALIGGNRRG